MAIRRNSQPAKGTFSLAGLSGKDLDVIHAALGLYQSQLRVDHGQAPIKDATLRAEVESRIQECTAIRNVLSD